MKKYLITLSAPSLGLISESDYYIEPYIVQSDSLEDLSTFVDEKLMRKFASDYKVALSDVRIVFAAPLK